MAGEDVEAALPEPLVTLEPLDRTREGGGFEAARTPLRVATTTDQTCPLEHLQVPRDRGKADVERLGELVHRCLSLREPGEDRPSSGIGQRGEHDTEAV